jgi:hypothetical protein
MDLNKMLAKKGGTYTKWLEPARNHYGYYVSVIDENAKVFAIPREELTEYGLIENHPEVLKTITKIADSIESIHLYYVGLWITKDYYDTSAMKIYVDKTRWVFDLNDAIKLGKDNKQEAIWDIFEGKEIKI